jgi:FlaA1/EpsC-like NDP-sugar epimerase
LRPGEKLFEEPLSDRERALPTPHPKLRIAQSGEPPDEAWLAEVEAWLSQARSPDDDEVRRELGKRVPEYASSPPGGVSRGAPSQEEG